MASFIQYVLNSNFQYGDSELDSEVYSSQFGDLFMPNFGSPCDKMFEDFVPEFDLDGIKEENLFCQDETLACLSQCHTQKVLTSTQASEERFVDSSDKSDLESEIGLNLETPEMSVHSSSNLKKRSPILPLYPTQICSLVASKNSDEFEQIQALRNLLAVQICKLIDREVPLESDLSQLDEESMQLFSNFSFLIYKVAFPAKNPLDVQIDQLQKAIHTDVQKKKRNEERIKYVFKRVNKIILKRFMANSASREESESSAIKRIIFGYFSNGEKYDHAEKMPGYDRYFTLLFKPSNMYRNDLKDIFSFTSYAQDFKSIVQNEFLKEYQAKRTYKIEAYLISLKNEIFYSTNQSDPSILKHKLSRLPWSLAEVEKGIALIATALDQ